MEQGNHPTKRSWIVFLRVYRLFYPLQSGSLGEGGVKVSKNDRKRHIMNDNINVSIQQIDEWISGASQCKLLPEADVKAICDMVAPVAVV